MLLRQATTNAWFAIGRQRQGSWSSSVEAKWPRTRCRAEIVMRSIKTIPAPLRTRGHSFWRRRLPRNVEPVTHRSWLSSARAGIRHRLTPQFWVSPNSRLLKLPHIRRSLKEAICPTKRGMSFTQSREIRLPNRPAINATISEYLRPTTRLGNARNAISVTKLARGGSKAGDVRRVSSRPRPSAVGDLSGIAAWNNIRDIFRSLPLGCQTRAR